MESFYKVFENEFVHKHDEMNRCEYCGSITNSTSALALQAVEKLKAEHAEMLAMLKSLAGPRWIFDGEMAESLTDKETVLLARKLIQKVEGD